MVKRDLITLLTGVFAYFSYKFRVKTIFLWSLEKIRPFVSSFVCQKKEKKGYFFVLPFTVNGCFLFKYMYLTEKLKKVFK